VKKFTNYFYLLNGYFIRMPLLYNHHVHNFRNAGFTLVELMVVVAIIGILTAIAVPNFKKYQAKSKQSEAKIQLAAIYSVEVSAQADYDSFATCLTDIGYDQPPRGYYTAGFNAAFTSGVTTRGATCSSSNYVAPTKTLQANTALAAVAGTDLDYTTPTSSTFKAGDTGNISPGKTTFDKWTIDEKKTISNSAVGY
jgi:type IV pilus assembly protein PilA